MRAENIRLRNLLKMTPEQAAAAAPGQAAFFEAPPGMVHNNAALARLQPGGAPLLAVATGSYAGEGFDCPPLDTLFLAAPVAHKGRLHQYAGRIMRPYPGKSTAEAHDYHDELTGVLASSLTKRAPGYTSLGFPGPRNLPYTPSAGTKTSQGRKGVQMNPGPDQAGQPA